MPRKSFIFSSNKEEIENVAINIAEGAAIGAVATVLLGPSIVAGLGGIALRLALAPAVDMASVEALSAVASASNIGIVGGAGAGGLFSMFSRSGAGSSAELTLGAESAAIRQRVLSNITESELARSKSNFGIHALIEKIPTLNVNTGLDEAVFWSGRGNRELAELYASVTGKSTLGMTHGGQYLDSLKLFDRYSNKQAILPWERLSERFAQGASGSVTAFADTSRSASVFNRIEYPILRENPNVTEIIFSPEIRYQNNYRYK